MPMFADAVNQLVDLVIQLEKSLTERRSPGKKMCLFIGGETAAHVLSSLYGDLSELDSIIAQRSTHPSYHMMTGTRSLTLNLYSLNTSMINRYISNNRATKWPNRDTRGYFIVSGDSEKRVFWDKYWWSYSQGKVEERGRYVWDEENSEDLGFSHEQVRAVRKSWIYSFDLQKVQNARDLLNTKEIKRDIFPHLAFGKGCMHKKVTLTPNP